MAARRPARRSRSSEYQTHFPRRWPVDETGFAEDLEVVRDGGLALAERLHEVAHADLALIGGGQHGQHAEANGVGEGGESQRQDGGFVGVERCGEDGRAAFFDGDLDQRTLSGHF
jgi:hypothetical protein